MSPKALSALMAMVWTPAILTTPTSSPVASNSMQGSGPTTSKSPPAATWSTRQTTMPMPSQAPLLPRATPWTALHWVACTPTRLSSWAQKLGLVSTTPGKSPPPQAMFKSMPTACSPTAAPSAATVQTTLWRCPPPPLKTAARFQAKATTTSPPQAPPKTLAPSQQAENSNSPPPTSTTAMAR